MQCEIKTKIICLFTKAVKFLFIFIFGLITIAAFLPEKTTGKTLHLLFLIVNMFLISDGTKTFTKKKETVIFEFEYVLRYLNKTLNWKRMKMGNFSETLKHLSFSYQSKVFLS
jgi:hypothetical protein